MTAEPNGAPAAMARASPVAAAAEEWTRAGRGAAAMGRTASGAARIRNRPSPARPMTTSTSRWPIMTMARPGSPFRAWAKAM